MYTVESEYIGKTIVHHYYRDSFPLKVKENSLLYEIISNDGKLFRTIRAKNSLTVERFFYLTNYVFTASDVGTAIISVGDACKHGFVVDDLCVFCNELVLYRNNNINMNKDDELIISSENKSLMKVTGDEARRIKQECVKNLLKQSKLLLALDLDQTLIHATNKPYNSYLESSNCVSIKEALSLPESDFPSYQIDIESNLEDLKIDGVFFMYRDDFDENATVQRLVKLIETQIIKFHSNIMINSESVTIVNYYKFRPGVFKFLRECCKYFDLTLFTAADASHATAALAILDPDRQFFKLVLTRTHLLDNKLKSLSKILPAGHGLIAVIDDTKHAWEKDVGILLCQPYVFFPCLNHFLFNNDVLSYDYRNVAERMAYTCYFPTIINSILSGHSNSSHDCDDVKQKTNSVVNVFNNAINYAQTHLCLPNRLSDSDCQLQCFYHILKLAHQLYFDVIRSSLQQKEDPVKVSTLRQILSVLASKVLKDVVFYVHGSISIFIQSTVYQLGLYFGASYADNVTDATHVLNLDPNPASFKALAHFYKPVVSTNFIFIAAVTYWRPHNYVESSRLYRSVFDRIRIVNNSSNINNWPRYDGILLKPAFITTNTDNEHCFSTETLNLDDAQLFNVASSYSTDILSTPDKVTSYNTDHTSACTNDTDLFKPNVMNSGSTSKRSKFDDIPQESHSTFTDIIFVNYDNWFKHHNFVFENELCNLLENYETMPTSFFNNIEESFVEDIFNGL